MNTLHAFVLMDFEIILGLHQKKQTEQKIKLLWKLLVKVKSNSSKELQKVAHHFFRLFFGFLQKFNNSWV